MTMEAAKKYQEPPSGENDRIGEVIELKTARDRKLKEFEKSLSNSKSYADQLMAITVKFLDREGKDGVVLRKFLNAHLSVIASLIAVGDPRWSDEEVIEFIIKGLKERLDNL